MLHFLSATLSQYFIMIKNSLEVCHIGTYFYKKWHMKHLCAKKRLLAKNEKLTAIICTETFVDDLLSIKLSFENVFLFPRRHLYLIHILWIIEKHKYDKSAELRRIKSLWIGEWMACYLPHNRTTFQFTSSQWKQIKGYYFRGQKVDLVGKNKSLFYHQL